MSETNININLTDGEFRVLRALFNSASENGHDFGFIEDARVAVENPSRLSGFVSQLVQKGLITVEPTQNYGAGPCTQFLWAKDIGIIETIISASGRKR